MTLLKLREKGEVGEGEVPSLKPRPEVLFQSLNMKTSFFGSWNAEKDGFEGPEGPEGQPIWQCVKTLYPWWTSK